MATASWDSRPSLESDFSFHQIQPEELLVDKNQASLIGHGGFGAVYKGIYLTHGRKQIAVKFMHSGVIPDGGLSKPVEDELIQEAKNMYAVRSEYVVSIYGMVAVPETKTYALVMEFMEHGSMDSLIKKVGNEIPLAVRISMLTNVASGLVWMHQNRMIHRDVKVQNILVNRSFVCKQITTKQYSSKDVKGTKSHIAPEFFKDIRTKPSEKTDVFSFGITLYEMVTGFPPYPVETMTAIIVAHLEKGNSPFDEEALNHLKQKCPDCPNFLINLMNNCVLKPEHRPDFKAIASILHSEYYLHYEAGFNEGCAKLYQRLCSQQYGPSSAAFNQVPSNTDATDAPMQQGSQTNVKTAWPPQVQLARDQTAPPNVQLQANWQQGHMSPTAPPQSHYSPPPSYHSEDPQGVFPQGDQRAVRQPSEGSTTNTIRNQGNKFQLHSQESLPGHAQFVPSNIDPNPMLSHVSSVHGPQQETGMPKSMLPLLQEHMEVSNVPYSEISSNIHPLNSVRMASGPGGPSQSISYSPAQQDPRQAYQPIGGRNNVGRYTGQLNEMQNRIRVLEIENLRAQIHNQSERNQTVPPPSYTPIQQNCIDHYQNIVQDLQPQNVLSYLIQDGYLTLDDSDLIKSKQVRRPMAEELIRILLSKPEGAMRCLAFALFENGQGHLSHFIDPTFQSSPM